MGFAQLWSNITGGVTGAFTMNHLMGSGLGVIVAVGILLLVSSFTNIVPNPLFMGLGFWAIFIPSIMVGDAVALAVLGSMGGGS